MELFSSFFKQNPNPNPNVKQPDLNPGISTVKEKQTLGLFAVVTYFNDIRNC
jgi:hypothetical protein